MTGAFLRVKRKEKWVSEEVEFLSDEERQELLGNRDSEELMRWLNLVCKTLADLEERVFEYVPQGSEI